jgi:hypothetical protein
MKGVPYASNYATLTLPKVTGNLGEDVEGFYNTISIPIDDTTTALSSTDKITPLFPPTKVDPDAPWKLTMDNLLQPHILKLRISEDNQRHLHLMWPGSWSG